MSFGEIGNLVDKNILGFVHQRQAEFNKLLQNGKTVFNFSPFMEVVLEADVFSEACFCILTANFRADKSILMQKNLGIQGCKQADYDHILEVLQKHGHRFARQRAERILALRQVWQDVQQIINQLSPAMPYTQVVQARKELKSLVNGYGLKEASHFMRNIGVRNIAIIDRHILRFLVDAGLVPKPKAGITNSVYLQAEQAILDLAKHYDLPPSALDLAIFYKQTGMVLK